MTQDEIAQVMQDTAGNSWGDEAHFQRFAALVAAASAAAENKACAKMCDHILKEGGGTWGDAIRARRQA
jgi:hypothetical protein